jgi:hypothetical protein
VNPQSPVVRAALATPALSSVAPAAQAAPARPTRTAFPLERVMVVVPLFRTNGPVGQLIFRCNAPWLSGAGARAPDDNVRTTGDQPPQGGR